MSNPYAGIICRQHGHVDIDHTEYMRQMSRPDALWMCPTCGCDASFDDHRYEELNPMPEETSMEDSEPADWERNHMESKYSN